MVARHPGPDRPRTCVYRKPPGFRRYWRWKSRRAARADPADERRERALEAPRIRGELLKLGFELAQSSFARYMAKVFTKMESVEHL